MRVAVSRSVLTIGTQSDALAIGPRLTNAWSSQRRNRRSTDQPPQRRADRRIALSLLEGAMQLLVMGIAVFDAVSTPPFLNHAAEP